MLVFICCPKPFLTEEEGKIISIVQKNTIQSWKYLDVEKKIIVCGNEKGVSAICKEYNLIYLPDIEVNEWNTPILADIFRKSYELVENNDVVCYINCDIMLRQDFVDNIQTFQKHFPKKHRFMLVGQRTDWKNPRPIDQFDAFRKGHLIPPEELKLHSPTGIDYFVHMVDTFDLDKIPPFAIGKFYWDRWLMGYCLSKRILTVDLTKTCQVIHQETPYYQNKSIKIRDDIWKSEELDRNRFYDAGLGRNLDSSKYFSYFNDSKDILFRKRKKKKKS